MYKPLRVITDLSDVLSGEDCTQASSSAPTSLAISIISKD